MLVPYPALWTDTILSIGQRDVRDDQLCISGLDPFCLNQQLKLSKKAFSVARLAWMCFRKSCGLTYVTSKFVVQSKRWYCMSFICSLDGSKKPRPTPIPKRKRKSLAHHAGGVHARCCRQRGKELASNVRQLAALCVTTYQSSAGRRWLASWATRIGKTTETMTARLCWLHPSLLLALIRNRWRHAAVAR